MEELLKYMLLTKYNIIGNKTVKMSVGLVDGEGGGLVYIFDGINADLMESILGTMGCRRKDYNNYIIGCGDFARVSPLLNKRGLLFDAGLSSTD